MFKRGRSLVIEGVDGNWLPELCSFMRTTSGRESRRMVKLFLSEVYQLCFACAVALEHMI
jgi:hypothetical protein